MSSTDDTPDDAEYERPARFVRGELEAWMRAAQAGDQRAYAELLGRVTPWLRQYIRRQRAFLQAADVEDLVQEVLLSLHAVRGTYDPGRPFLPWLLAITHNRLTDAARRHARQSAREIPAGGLEGDDVDGVTSWGERANTQDGASQLGAVDAAEDAVYAGGDHLSDTRALARAIRGLPERQRAAIDLLKLREMSLKEAAQELGTTVGALKVSVHRAMTSLRRTLARATSKE